MSFIGLNRAFIGLNRAFRGLNPRAFIAAGREIAMKKSIGTAAKLRVLGCDYEAMEMEELRLGCYYK